MALPLQNIKILDLGTLTPGKYCTFLLGDFGAEVIRIERPVPDDAPESDRLSDEDLILNRNKRSITLNLKEAAAKQVFYQLSAKADVILESNRPGVARRIGVDYETIKVINPDIIYCSLSGYGQDGPYQQLPGFDIVFLGISGLLTLLGGQGQPRVVPGLYLADTAAGLFTTIGILTALVAREKTGQGQFIDLAMLDVAFSWLAISRGTQYPSQPPSSQDDDATMELAPGYHIYQTRNGKNISLGIGRQQSWASLCQALGREEFTDRREATGEKREEIVSFLNQAFRTKTQEEWLQQLRALDIEVGPVNTPDEAFIDPHLQYRQMALDMEHPIKGKIRQVGIPIKFSETPGEVRRTAPLIGQDTASVLQELGYTPERIEELRQAQAI